MLSIPIHTGVAATQRTRSFCTRSFRWIGAIALAPGLIAALSALALTLSGSARANSTEVAGYTHEDAAEIAGVILSDDAMPQGPSVAERLAIIRQKIQDALVYPPLAQLQSSDGDAMVRFEIDRSGNAHNVRLVRSSGHDQLDESAIRAVATASPLPWVYGSLEIPVHFELIESR